MNRKAQTATEYLIILAVVIVVALIVVGVMGGIPGIGNSAGSKASKAFWQSADIAIDSYAITASGNATLNIRNNIDSTVTLTAFTVNGVSLGTLGTISEGGSTTLTANDASLCGNAGDAFSHAISITYTNGDTGQSYTITGNGHELEGVCAN